MRSRGRHGREMEERFCFLVASHETTTQVYQHGLRTETQEHYSLGKPSHGIYLFKHVDVALKHAATSTLNGKNLIIFKVCFTLHTYNDTCIFYTHSFFKKLKHITA